MSLVRIGPLLALSLPLLPACFLGYDSRWGQAKAAQQHAAQAATPADIAAEGHAERPASRVMHVRVYATPAYAAQAVDWRRDVEATFDDADAVLEPALGVRLEPEGFATWDVGGAEGDLHAALEALSALDRATDVDWVVGFVAGTPMASDSFHDAGMAKELGRHLVVRARNVAAEASADKAFAGLDDDARAKLVKARRRHRATALLLHELGHTLGAIHDRDRTSLMYPRYDEKETGYLDEDVALMRVGMEHRSEPRSWATAAATARDLLGVFEENGDARWVPEERVAMMAGLRATVAAGSNGPPPASAASSPPPPPLPADVGGLPEGDRDAYGQALAALRTGDARGAWTTAQPLYEKYPDVLSVQDLRCKIAMQTGGSFAAVKGECEPLMRLSTAPR